MMLLTMNTYLPLLWGISVLFSMEIESATIPDTSSSSSSTAEPNNAATQLYTSHVRHNETETPTYKPADMSSGATAVTAVSLVMETQEANVSSPVHGSNVSTTGTVVTNVAAETASSSPHFVTSAGQATPSHDTVSSETAKPTEEQQSPTVSARMTAPATTSAVTTSTLSAASLGTAAASSPRPTSTTEHEVKPELSSTTSSDYLTQAPHFIQILSAASTSTMTTNATNQTSEAAPVFNPTSFPMTKSETAPAATAELSSTSRATSGAQTRTSTSELLDTAGSSSATDPATPSQHISTDSAVSTTAFSTSPAGVHPVPERLPVPTTKSAAISTTAPHEASQSPATTKDQPCSSRRVVTQCLIAIASLAGLATIFMVSTIVLCTKLSARKYKLKKPQHGTEMICISSLMPERNYTYTRQRNPVSNGVLVIPTGGDSDEDAGDNLTLSSFLPENDRV